MGDAIHAFRVGPPHPSHRVYGWDPPHPSHRVYGWDPQHPSHRAYGFLWAARHPAGKVWHPWAEGSRVMVQLSGMGAGQQRRPSQRASCVPTTIHHLALKWTMTTSHPRMVCASRVY